MDPTNELTNPYLTGDWPQPDPAASAFTLPDGTVYTLTETLWPKRYKVFQKRQQEFGFNHTFGGFAQELDKIWADFNENQRSAAGIQKLGNLRDNTTYLGNNRIAALEVCGLFFNAPDESPLTYDHPQMLAKLERWETSGISVDFFFVQAARLVPDFYKRLLESSLSPTEPAADSAA